MPFLLTVVWNPKDVSRVYNLPRSRPMVHR